MVLEKILVGDDQIDFARDNFPFIPKTPLEQPEIKSVYVTDFGSGQTFEEILVSKIFFETIKYPISTPFDFEKLLSLS